jgi:hypothetical protein
MDKNSNTNIAMDLGILLCIGIVSMDIWIMMIV